MSAPWVTAGSWSSRAFRVLISAIVLVAAGCSGHDAAPPPPEEPVVAAAAQELSSGTLGTSNSEIVDSAAGSVNPGSAGGGRPADERLCASSIRQSAVKFNLSAYSGAVVSAATVQVNKSAAQCTGASCTAAGTFTLHRLTGSFTDNAGSNALGSNGWPCNGGAASSGALSFNAASATAAGVATGSSYSFSGANVVADVQSMIDGTNYGWLLSATAGVKIISTVTLSFTYTWSNGHTCSAGSDCNSGNCVDGYCCNSSCGGLCQACSAAKKHAGSNGTCGNIANGSDDDGECTNTCGTGTCNGSGACGTTTEVCDNFDNNCAGSPAIDEGCDDDNDNYCDSGMTKAAVTVTTCSSTATAATVGDDCNDTSSAIKPGATEICDNVDNDCAGSPAIDTGCDDDNDNYCDSSMTKTGGVSVTTCTSTATAATAGDDCNDAVAAVKPGATEVCDNVDNDCAGSPAIDTGCDDDNDNYCDSGMTKSGGVSVTTCTSTATAATAGDDCNDGSPGVNPGATEICDSIDNNCAGSPAIDEGCDDDNDNYCDSAMTVSGTPTTCTSGGGDCSDGNSAINPGITEICDNIDNNCAGSPAIDEGCDDDNDNYCDSAMTKAGSTVVTTCSSTSSSATVGDDCNDGVSTIKPGTTEICDNLDNNCNGSTDEGCDDDNDDYCDSGMTKAASTVVGTCASTSSAATTGDDCNDASAAIKPGATEICDSVDNNCAGSPAIDEGCDDDNDNYCDSGMTVSGTPTTCTAGGGDCADSNGAINPGATEICDNADNNCAGSPAIDEGCDDDNDNYCDSGMTKAGSTSVTTCTSTSSAATVGDDCDDTLSTIKPGATEICDNADNNCNSSTDEGCDDDNDNYCDSGMTKAAISVTTCTSTSSGATVGDDCNDASAAIKPGATEICDSLDNNCAGSPAVDEGCDDDNDNYCDSAMTVSGVPGTCTGGGGDCDDTSSSINPGATEVCDNVDNDCTGSPAIDTGCDDDNDNYCDSGMTVVGSPTTCTSGGGDCNDASSTIKPGATEICDNVDNNCAGSPAIDEGCDDDNDNYCDSGMTKAAISVTTCTATSSGATVGDDCNDASASIKPGATEVCDNVDQNCTGGADDGCDDDNDDWCDVNLTKTAVTVTVCPNSGTGTTSAVLDCDDTLASSYPGATESCDGVDNSCTSGIDEGCDDDGDTYCDSARDCTAGAACVCTGGSGGKGGDCADTDSSVNPGAAEKCDTTDNNCSGANNEGCDNDSDTYCDSAMVCVVGNPTCSCTGGSGSNGGDCNDTNGAIKPGATEICDNVDQNCASGADDGCDDDNDDYCDSGMTKAGGTTVTTCASTAAGATTGDDCDDTVATIKPGATEICDNLDNNCTGSPAVDEGCDDDNDDYCDAAIAKKGNTTITLCPNTAAAATVGDDCNDAVVGIKPGATEICDNLDNNCAGSPAVDEGCDDDNDNYCDSAMTKTAVSVTTCTSTATGATVGDDCDDTVAGTKPGAAEICDNIDQNCGAGTDEGCDDDNDDYCDASMSKAAGVTVTVCNLTGSAATVGNDCDDSSSAIKPSATEICDNLDNNCAGSPAIDEGCDDDNDNYCDSAMTKAAATSVSTCSATAAGATVGDDCNDASATIKPNATEICDNLDNNCAGSPAIDEGCDDDNDGWCDVGMTKAAGAVAACPSSGAGTSAAVLDCFDNRGEAYPGATEICNGLDENCDGAADSPAPPTTTCGVGACQATGGTCVGGVPTGCNPGSPGAETCNNVDDNCNGSIDDGVPLSTCGVGACARTGSTCFAASCTPGTGTTETCNGIDDDCNGTVDDGCDDDGDDFCDSAMTVVGSPAVCPNGGGDCNDAVAAIKPGATEVCDNLDNNCAGSPAIDEGCDDDNDNYCDSGKTKTAVSVTTCTATAAGALVGDDCDDTDAAIKPGASEVCDNIDNNCGAGTDEGCDDDNDNYCDAAVTKLAGVIVSTCTATASGATLGNDCNDAVAAVNPGALESCDGVDNNCSGSPAIDEGCDDDGDDYCDSSMTTVGTPAVCPNGGGDCDDASASTKPGAAEICDNIDQNCAAGADEGCDDDNDDRCDATLTKAGGVTVSTCASTPAANTVGDDCNDTNAAIKPGAAEVCDNTDNDCGAGIDEGCDDDNDNFCDSGLPKTAVSVTTCTGTAAAATVGDDCDDTSAAIKPGASEVCDNIDQNCGGGIDEGCDDDNDDRCDSTMTKTAGVAITTCTLTPTAGTVGDDCNDNDPNIKPGATEICDGTDNNCAGGSDEGCDDDGDDYCDSALTTVGTPAACPNGGGDCNDTSASIKPGATEVCDNVDQNCTAGADDGCDDDGDGYCDATRTKAAVAVTVCPSTPTGATAGDDCNDAAAAIHPGATETCNGADENCAGGSDEGCDDDNDDYCDSAMTIVGTPPTCASGGGDCNDTSASIKPGAAEICDNVDQNCGSGADEGCDDDGDGYCDATRAKAAVAVTACPSTPAGATVGDDCNDTAPAVHPGAAEICNGADDNCAGTPAIDEGCDDDNDDYCDSSIALVGSSPTCTGGSGDCDDTNAAIKPGATETCDNLDNNCGTGTDEGCDDDADGYCDATRAKAAVAVTACPNTPAAATTGDDCADTNGAVHPGATETCNGADENCAAGIDEGCDDDNDDYCDAAMTLLGTSPTCPNGGGDCNDTSSGVRPGAAETCNNVDDDCSGAPDEGCDDDNDDYCDSSIAKAAGVTVTTCASTPAAATTGDDCADTVAAIHPGVTEACDGIDNDCTLGPDNGCDQDGDGYCQTASGSGPVAACPGGGGDCNDGNPNVHPGVLELCNDVDDNCGGGTDEGCDDDGDGYCDLTRPTTGTPAVCPNGPGDCDDATATTFPGAAEACDNFDNNCAGTPSPIDEGCDDDNDDFCDAAMPKLGGVFVTVCQNTPQAATQGDDCDDSAATGASFNPNVAEICDNKDNDCTGGVDNGCDDDNDDYCDSGMTKSAGVAVTTCTSTPAAATTGDDCSDDNVAIHPAAAEICDDVDQDCNASIDDGCDDDGDQYCDAALSLIASGKCPNGGGDCDDASANSHPGAPELCDLADNDCNALVDDNISVLTCGVGACSAQATGCVNGVPQNCTPGTPTTEQCNVTDDDCDGLIDNGVPLATCGVGECARVGATCDPASCTPGPSVAETCDGKDNDCDGAVDNGIALAVCGVGACSSVGSSCDPASCTAGAPLPEVCDGVDNDCNGAADDGIPVAHCGTGTCASTGTTCQPTTCIPGAPTGETCNDLDDDCDGVVDNGCDDDDDGYCDSNLALTTATTCPSGGGDCDDEHASAHPGATEQCNDKDDDCNGAKDDGNVSPTCGVGECQRTGTSCNNGVAENCTPGPEALEACNGKDDDCNDKIDDGVPDLTCGVGECQVVIAGCDNGLVPTCVPLDPTAESCNGRDDDCNGEADDGDLCPAGQACVGGACLDVDGGVDGGAGSAGAGGSAGSAGAAGSGGGAGTSPLDAGTDGDAEPPSGGGNNSQDSGGCGCRTAPNDAGSRSAWLVAGAVALLTVRRRRSRSLAQ